MKNLYSAYRAILLLLVSVSLSQSLLAQAPAISWQKCYGGEKNDVSGDMKPTPDGGAIFTTWTESTSGDITSYKGMFDAWMVKINATGTIDWQKNIGTSFNDQPYSIILTADGGYIVTGASECRDGDITGGHGGAGFDAFVVKINSTGTILWSKAIGSTGNEGTYSSSAPTPDGGCVIAFATTIVDGDITQNNGMSDVYLMKLSAAGNIVWKKNYGGTQYESATNIQPTPDGGFIVTGSTSSSDIDIVTGNHGKSDVLLIKTDSSGNKQWIKTYGGLRTDGGLSTYVMPDGSYVVAAITSSLDGDVTTHADSSQDIWILKLNTLGNIVWQKTYGGSKDEAIPAIRPAFDGGYIFTASAASTDGDVTDHKGLAGKEDIWTVKLDSVGNITWSKSLGGIGIDLSNTIYPTVDGGYLIYGQVVSNDGDVTGNHGGAGKWDTWVVKLGGGVSVEPLAGKNSNIKVYPTITNDVVNIDLPQGYEKAGIRMVNTLGQEIPFTQKGAGLQRRIYMDNIPAAMYILYITNEGSTNSFKISYQQ